MKKFIFISIIVLLGMITSCSEHKYPDLGDGYKFGYDGKYTLCIVNFENNIVITETILEYGFDSTFIIVSQRPWDSIPNIKKMTYTKSNEAFENSNFLQYWIINKKEKSEFNEATKIYSNVYGPYKKEEYFQKREELGIPKELKLKE